MRFSGHETFAIREGWLYKGLNTLSESPDFFEEPYPADRLGVGSNMSKSIRHWLLATGVAERIEVEGRARGLKVRVSKFGELIQEHDPYLNRFGTMCMLHVNLANFPDSTATWDWFFGSFSESVFDRNDAAEHLMRWAKLKAAKVPSPTTLKKDLNCLLASYASRGATEGADPEDAVDCPLWELGLLDYYRGSQSFRTNRSAKDIPLNVIGYALALSDTESRKNLKFAELSIDRAASRKGGPGRAFLLGPGPLYETVSRAIENENRSPQLTIETQAGERTLKYRNLDSLGWAKLYYSSSGA